MLWYIGHLFGCRLRRREKGHGVSIRTALRLLYHMRPTRCYRQSGKDFASKIVQPARGRHGPAAVSGYFRSAGRFLCCTSAAASLPCHGSSGTLGRQPYRTASGWLAASFAPPLLPQASHVTGPARAGGHIGLLPVGWPLPLLYLRCRKPPTSRGRHGPAAISGYFRSAGRFLCCISPTASLPCHGSSGTLVRRKTCAL